MNFMIAFSLTLFVFLFTLHLLCTDTHTLTQMKHIVLFQMDKVQI